MKKNFIFPVFVILIVTLLYIFSGEEIVPTPADSIHVQITEEPLCLDCHGEEGENPLSKEHPPKYQCFACHETEKKNT